MVEPSLLWRLGELHDINISLFMCVSGRDVSTWTSKSGYQDLGTNIGIHLL